jgi:hypothetical protein
LHLHSFGNFPLGNARLSPCASTREGHFQRCSCSLCNSQESGLGPTGPEESRTGETRGFTGDSSFKAEEAYPAGTSGFVRDETPGVQMQGTLRMCQRVSTR